MKKIYLIIATVLLAGVATAQNELYNNGGLIHINANCIVQVNGAVINKATSTITNNGTLNVTGNVTNDATLVFNAGLLAFKGTTPQILNGTTTYNAKDVLVDNEKGVTLNSKLIADGTVTFTKGIVKASATTTPFVFTTNATVTGAADASHVNGYVIWRVLHQIPVFFFTFFQGLLRLNSLSYLLIQKQIGVSFLRNIIGKCKKHF